MSTSKLDNHHCKLDKHPKFVSLLFVKEFRLKLFDLF